MVQLGNYFTCRTGVTAEGIRGIYTCYIGFKLRFPGGTEDAKKSVGGTQSLSLVGRNFKAKQKYAEFSLAKKHV